MVRLLEGPEVDKEPWKHRSANLVKIENWGCVDLWYVKNVWEQVNHQICPFDIIWCFDFRFCGLAVATQSPHEGGSLTPWLLDWSARFCARSRVWAESRRFASRPRQFQNVQWFNGFDKISFSKHFFFLKKEVKEVSDFFLALNAWTLDESHFVFSHLGKANRTEMKSNHMLDSPIVLLRSVGSVIYTLHIHMRTSIAIIYDCHWLSYSIAWIIFCFLTYHCMGSLKSNPWWQWRCASPPQRTTWKDG